MVERSGMVAQTQCAQTFQDSGYSEEIVVIPGQPHSLPTIPSRRLENPDTVIFLLILEAIESQYHPERFGQFGL